MKVNNFESEGFIFFIISFIFCVLILIVYLAMTGRI